ncbi:MAG: hypothetical protein E3J72_07085 [Planctomycetota bacterium]|nr:MAG: hypothetical protein E3J72_07085 [Planctomycetota bacterium]
MATTCQRCGKAHDTGARYCTQCGYDMSTGLTLQTPVPSAPTPTPSETPSGPSVPTVTMAPPPQAKDPLIGEEVGGCIIEKKIGQGGMGSVYLGVQSSLDRPVAIKILPSDLAQNSAYITRFLRESKIVASIRHPNIVSVYDRGRHGEVYFFIMEFIQGRTIGQLLREHGTIGVGDALEVTRQSAFALGAAAEKNIIHRDIKPDNIMIDEGGIVKVTDFGLVKNTADTTGGVTATHQVMGTPAFMSPEQCKGDPADNRSDIYSLGMTLYAMLTGKPAFRAETTHGLLMKQITELPAPAHEVNTNVHESAWPVLKSMIEKNVNDRLQDWPAVIEALDNLRDSLPETYALSGLLQRSSATGMKGIAGAQRTPLPTPMQTPMPTPTESPRTFDIEKPGSSPSALQQPSGVQPARGGGLGIALGIGIGAIAVIVAVVLVLYLVKDSGKKEPESGTGTGTIAATTGGGTVRETHTGASVTPAGTGPDKSAEVNSLLAEISSNLESGDLASAKEKMNQLRRTFGKKKHPRVMAALQKAEQVYGKSEPLWSRFHKARVEAQQMERSGRLIDAENTLKKVLKDINDRKVRDSIIKMLALIADKKPQQFKLKCEAARKLEKEKRWDEATAAWKEARRYASRSHADNSLCDKSISAIRTMKATEDKNKSEAERYRTLLEETKKAYRRRDIEKAAKNIAELNKLKPGNKEVAGLADKVNLETMVSVKGGAISVGKIKLTVPAFKIGVYEVTNRQYREFINAGGYSTGEYWSRIGWQWKMRNGFTRPGFWYDSKFNGDRQPVVGVSWYEAQAYCKWLSKASGKKYRLPTFGEWWRAAAGPKGATWPWGSSDKNPPANLRDSASRSTAVVGKYPKGNSAVGCRDIVGNAAEWCSRGLRHYACGGSWMTFLEDVSLDSLRPIRSTMRLNQLGFRCVRED